MPAAGSGVARCAPDKATGVKASTGSETIQVWSATRLSPLLEGECASQRKIQLTSTKINLGSRCDRRRSDESSAEHMNDRHLHDVRAQNELSAGSDAQFFTTGCRTGR